MARAARLLLLAAMVVPVGCENKADSIPNTALGPPPNIPPGRGGDKGIAPVNPKAPKQPK